MKKKTGCIIAVILAATIPLAAGLLLLLFPPLAAVFLMGNVQLAERNSSGFDLEGVVTDDAGHPLSGVTMQVTFS